jgi:hypothetical protein
MCLLITLLVLGPRAGLVIYWLGWPARWDAAFDTFIVPFIGWVLLPWTTLMYVLAAPDGVDGFDYVLLALGVLADLATLAGGGGYGSRRARAGARGSVPPGSAW